MTNSNTLKEGICPACNGTTRVPASGSSRKVVRGYCIDTDTFPCCNCGGQRMFGSPSGKVPLRKDNTPCMHSYKGRGAGHCYTIYTCEHCNDSYSIDSGD
jgi:hypothetical protein